MALALEKLAEYVHERRQLSEARRDLAAEVTENGRSWALNVAEASRIQDELNADLKIIRAVRSRAPAEGKLDYSVAFFAAKDGPWQAARQSGSLILMPDQELQLHAWFNGILASVMESMHTLETTLQMAGAIATSDTPEKLDARDLDDLASRTLEAQGRLANLKMFLHFEETGLQELQRATASRETPTRGTTSRTTMCTAARCI
ncbi:MAG TPA: hypothetical protein VHV81_15440 [Steroidobacteraceae bacterium]|nr:hypothetical protein [Steroidobacteraceae bacterium]